MLDELRHFLLIVDHGTFTEYGPLAGRSSDVEDDSPADGLVGGVGELGSGGLVGIFGLPADP